ncbi:MAG: hypothetical protein M3Z04_17795 [Chloroflexota bacterium]|nr:hypothetical protein [Chloroflexota bacterium]
MVYPPAAPPAAAPAPPPSHNPYIAAVICDHSTELGHAARRAANVPQALRLYQASTLDEVAFVARLHPARARVRLYQGQQRLGSIGNKMGYYFAVLADLCGPAPPS